MSEIHRYKKIDNNNNLIKSRLEANDKQKKISLHPTRKNTRIINMDRIFSKYNFDISRIKKPIQRSIMNDEFLTQKISKKILIENDSTLHKKNLTNIETDYNFIIKPEVSLDMKKLTENKKNKNASHRRMQTEKKNINLMNKKKYRTGNCFVLINYRNLRRNNDITRDYLYEENNTKNSSKTKTCSNLTVNLNSSFKKKLYKKINPLKKKNGNNLKRFLPEKLTNLTIENLLQSSNISSSKNKKKKYYRNVNSHSNESKIISNKNHYLTCQASFDNLKDESKSKTKSKTKSKSKTNRREIKLLHNEKANVTKDSIKVKRSLLNLKLNINKNSKMNIEKLFKEKKLIKHIKNNLVLPKNLKFQTKKIVKIEKICKRGFWQPGTEKANQANQDNYFIVNNINDNPKYYYMGVCDGHGMYGKEVSDFLVNYLPKNLNENIKIKNIKYLNFESINSLSKIIKTTFIQTNNELVNNSRINTYLSGSTCSSILFTPRKIISINVGDSRCILGKLKGNKWISRDLSRDHKPSEKDEKNRILSNEGRVEKYKDEFGNYNGPLRVWLKYEETPGLAMTRSFGDELAHKIGVIVEPEIKEYVFLSEDKFFIIGSDGLWEYISSEECVNMVKDFYLKNDIEGAIKYLYKESSKRWIMQQDVIDDITIIIVFMN